MHANNNRGSFYFIQTMYKTNCKMPRRKCNTCKKNKKKRASRRKHNESHKKHLSMMRGGMEGSKRPHPECMEGSPPSKRPHPEWWDLAVEGTHLDDRQSITNDTTFVSFTPNERDEYSVAAMRNFISGTILEPTIILTDYDFGCDTPNSVIAATATTNPHISLRSFTFYCLDSIQFNMFPSDFPSDIRSFGHSAPPRMNLFIKWHDEPIRHTIVPIREYYHNIRQFFGLPDQ